MNNTHSQSTEESISTSPDKDPALLEIDPSRCTLESDDKNKSTDETSISEKEELASDNKLVEELPSVEELSLEKKSPFVEPSNQAPPSLADEITQIEATLSKLTKRIEDYIAYSQKLQLIIDRQHDELERYRRGESRNLSLAVILDIIQELDSTRKTQDYYKELEPSPENYLKMHKFFSTFSQSLADILERHEVFTYQSNPGDRFAPKRQRIAKTIPTDDPSLVQTVAETIRLGFESADQTVIRHEGVAVYVAAKR